jgi:hypothetical protein
MLHLETWQCTHKLQRFLLLKNARIGSLYHLVFVSSCQQRGDWYASTGHATDATGLLSADCVPHLHCCISLGTWAYFATVLTSLTFTLVPFLSLVLGWHPVTFSKQVGRQGPVHCTATATALPLHCHCTATALPLHCHCTATALPLHCHCTATALPLHCTGSAWGRCNGRLPHQSVGLMNGVNPLLPGSSRL